MYATNRNLENTSDPKKYYGGERAATSYGVATVAISTKKNGDARYADWSRWQPRSERARNRNELIDVDPMAEGDFERALTERLAGSTDRAVLVYVHGFAKSFSEVARNMAIIAYEMDLRAVPVLYSWPSKGSPFAYSKDIMNLDWSTNRLVSLLHDLAAEPSIDTIHVIAHSLGNRAFLNAFVSLAGGAGSAERSKLGEIVLFAPDIDSNRFERDYLPTLQRAETRVTLYVSGRDASLRMSARVNDGKRVGDSKGRLIIADGIETVDVTAVVKRMRGHSSHRKVAEVQTDLYYLINERRAANNRPTVEPVDTERGRYWSAIQYDR